MGKRLVKELGLEPSVDTLGRWMAHYIAELLERAENGPDEVRNDARREVADLIIKLWVHRASLNMDRRPLQSFDSILMAIERLRGDTPIYFRGSRDRSERKASDDVERWLDTAIEVDRIARDLIEVCVNFAVANAAEDEKEWLRDGLNLLPENDIAAKVIIKLLEQKAENESPEELAIKRLNEFGNLYFQIAEEMRGKRDRKGNVDQK